MLTAWAQPPCRFYNVIETDALSEASLVAVALHGDVYEASQENYADVAIVDHDGRETPCLVDMLNFRPGQDLPEKQLYRDRHSAIAGFEISQSESRRETEVIVRSRREAWTALILELSDCNFRKQARVESADSDRRILATGTLSCFQLTGVRRKQLELVFPEQRCARYRLITENVDNPRPLGYPYRFRVNKVHEYILIFRKPDKSTVKTL